MKANCLLAICLIGISLSASAAVITVSNNAVSPTPFTTVSAAIAAASAGDTIYILGSPNTYDAFVVNKRLVFFGPGFRPERAGDKLTAITPGITLSSASSGTEIYGMVVTGNIQAAANLNNITISRNKISGFIGYTNSVSYTYNKWIISNNFLHNAILYSGASTTYHLNVSNTLVENNIIRYSGPVMNNVQGEGVLQLKNNLFITTSSNAAFTNCRSVILSNNIFINYSSGSLTTDSYAQHNLAYRGGQVLPASFFPVANALTRDNLINQDPLFVNLNPLTALESADFSLETNSPAVNAEADWKQMGVYGGNPASNWSYAHMPRLPYIHTFKLETTTVPVGGTLKLIIISKKQN